jgi:tetratricopeptide (TPR) repeat protein
MTLLPPRILPVFAAALLAFAVTVLLLRAGAPAPPVGADAVAETRIAVPSASTDRRIAVYQSALEAEPDSVDAAVLLAGAYLQKVRENGDATLYAKAEALVDGALRRAPRDAGALVARGGLELSRHDFAAALRDARAARRIAPQVVRPYGVLVDALVELGRYPAAGRALQRYVDLQPGLSSYARVSYLRELHGDLPGAIAALRLAAAAGGETAENVAYVQTLIGNLWFTRGRLGRASLAYREASARFPGYAPAAAGLARVDAADGDLSGAVRRLRGVVARLPLPEHLVALAELQLARGRQEAARRDLALVRAEQRLLAASGVDTDVDAAIFEAQHGSPVRAVRLARRAHRSAPSVRADDALGWALTRAGRPAAGLRWARRSLRLGSRDPMFAFHTGMAARAAGRPGEARALLRRSLALNPRFSPLYAPQARRALESLS